MKNRDRTEILAKIVGIANREGRGDNNNNDDDDGVDTGVIKNKIMFKALLSYSQTKGYLNFLTECELISYDSASRKYKTTQKGLRFFQIYNQMSIMIKTPHWQQQQQDEEEQIHFL
jgi:hypothetical protein